MFYSTTRYCRRPPVIGPLQVLIGSIVFVLFHIHRTHTQFSWRINCEPVSALRYAFPFITVGAPSGSGLTSRIQQTVLVRPVNTARVSHGCRVAMYLNCILTAPTSRVGTRSTIVNIYS